MTNEEIKKAKEFYGIYDFVSEENVMRLCENIKMHGVKWVKENTGILTRLSYKNW